MLTTDDERATTHTHDTDTMDDPETALVALLDETIGRYNRAIRHALEQSEGTARLTMPQLRALQAIAADGMALTTQLARRQRVAVPTMTSMIDGLAERGLVARQQSPTDRRQVQIRLTPDGYATLARYQAIAHARLREPLARLSARQKERVRAALGDMAAALDEHVKGGD